MKVMVSACLLGENCKYNGGNNRDEKVLAFLQDKEVIPVCPERILGMPRTPMEIVNGVLVNRDGETVDGIVRGQIEQIMQGLKDQPVDLAVLKSRSPTCGVKQVYDGTFSGTLIDGSGVLAQALQSAVIPTIDADDL